MYPGKIVDRIIRNDSVIPSPEKPPLSGKLKSEGFADLSIIGYIDEINSIGFETLSSCSGMRRDHYGHEEGAYLSIELPENVVKHSPYVYFFRYVPGIGYRTLDESCILNHHYVDVLIEAGENANWLTEPSVYMLMFPDVRFGIPKTKSVASDKRVIADPRLCKTEHCASKEPWWKHSGMAKSLA